jgi:hypothetical protein
MAAFSFRSLACIASNWPVTAVGASEAAQIAPNRC